LTVNRSRAVGTRRATQRRKQKPQRTEFAGLDVVAEGALAPTEIVREAVEEDVKPKVSFSSLTRHDGAVMEHSKAHPRMLKSASASTRARETTLFEKTKRRATTTNHRIGKRTDDGVRAV